jgi:hypothetical protein
MAQNKFLRFSSVGVQMAVLIYLGSELGKYLDEKYASEKNLYTALCVMAAVGNFLVSTCRGTSKRRGIKMLEKHFYSILISVSAALFCIHMVGRCLQAFQPCCSSPME